MAKIRSFDGGTPVPENLRLFFDGNGAAALCGYGHDDAVWVPQTGQVICGEEICGQPLMWPGEVDQLMRGAAIGLIEGRHPLPVEKYLLPANVTSDVGYHGGVKMAARQAAEKMLVPGGVVHLYATGLTTAVLGAIEGFKKKGVAVVLFDYDKESGKYIPIFA